MSECEEFKTILNVAETVGEAIVAAKQLSVDIPHIDEVRDNLKMEEPSIVSKDVKFFPETEEKVAEAIATVETVVEPVIEHMVETVIEQVVEPVIEQMVETVHEMETVLDNVTEAVHEMETILDTVAEAVHEIENVLDNVAEAVLDATAPEIETTPTQDKMPRAMRVMRLISKLLGCLRMYSRRSNKDTKVAI